MPCCRRAFILYCDSVYILKIIVGKPYFQLPAHLNKIGSFLLLMAKLSIEAGIHSKYLPICVVKPLEVDAKKQVSIYDQEIPQSHTADQHTAP